MPQGYASNTEDVKLNNDILQECGGLLLFPSAPQNDGNRAAASKLAG